MSFYFTFQPITTSWTKQSIGFFAIQAHAPGLALLWFGLAFPAAPFPVAPYFENNSINHT